MFNNFDLSDQEILKIIEDYKNLINKNSVAVLMRIYNKK